MMPDKEYFSEAVGVRGRSLLRFCGFGILAVQDLRVIALSSRIREELPR